MFVYTMYLNAPYHVVSSSLGFEETRRDAWGGKINQYHGKAINNGNTTAVAPSPLSAPTEKEHDLVFIYFTCRILRLVSPSSDFVST